MSWDLYTRDDDDPTCPTCGAPTEWESCWYCGGQGGFHDCGEDCCCCLHPEDNVTCSECHGFGGYQTCTRLPHTANEGTS